MTETSSLSPKSIRTSKQDETLHPYYFNSFQSYCCGPNSKAALSSSDTELMIIPEKFKLKTDEILHDINGYLVERLNKLAKRTSVLPRKFFEQANGNDYYRYLIDRTMFKMMNEAGVINWMPLLKRLYPVRTSGNGNCLLHAVLIAMAGVHDFDLHLRDRLLLFMNKNTQILKQTWKIERLKTDKMYGIQCEDAKLDSEWKELCDLVRYENSNDGQKASNLQFLEAVHIFSLSNMLARPIFILSEDVVRNKHGEAISYNDLFGIYLPILASPEECCTVPIVLAYDQSHFCPLQTTDDNTSLTLSNYLPLYQSIEHVRNQTLLPIRFLGNDANSQKNLLHKYLIIKRLPYESASNAERLFVPCAQLIDEHLISKYNFFLLYYEYIMDFFETQQKKLQETRQRSEQVYYSPKQSSYERLLMKNDDSSPPPSYSSVGTKSNENKNISNHERRSSYDKAVTNGIPYISSDDSNRPINQYSAQQQSDILQNYVQNDRRNPVSDNSQHKNAKQLLHKSSWDEAISGDEPISNEEIINNKNSRGSASKLKQDRQQQNSIQTTVNLLNNASSPNLIDFEQTDTIRSCILCKHFFVYGPAGSICLECHQSTKYPPPVRHSRIMRAPQMNTYLTTYKNSDFITSLPSSATVTIQPSIACPRCHHPIIINNVQNRTFYTCSACQEPLVVLYE